MRAYEQFQEEADIYYGQWNDEMERYGELILCPCCYSGALRDISPQCCQCSNCGIGIHHSSEDVQKQLAVIYQQHHCGKALVCNLNQGQQWHFTCPTCNFSYLLQ